MMEPHRLRAPIGDGSVLAEPPLDLAVPRLQANRAQTLRWDHDFQGRRAGRLRAMARRQAFEAAAAHHERLGLEPPPRPEVDAPLVVTGHQPDLFHPGVWVKNFAAADVALRAGGCAINLVVDNDIPKWAAVRVPTIDDAGTLHAVAVDFDDWSREVPFEDWTLDNPARFASFPDRVRRALGGRVPDPVLDEFWPEVLRASEHTDRPGSRFAAARRAVEGRWGVHNAEVPLSALCQTEAFGWFASHLLAHLPRFQAVHNDALRRYRETYGIRSKNHPVPALTGEADWLEAPFWVWRRENPRRRPLLARQEGKVLRLRVAGEHDPLGELPLAPDRDACCAVEALDDLARRGVRIRTRALTTTMFARLLLGDLFVHGIGGARYDELGDEVVRGFFGIEPPEYLTLSQTIWLGLPDDPASPEALRDAEREIRDLTFNPDRHLEPPAPEAVAELVRAKREAIAAPQDTRRQRMARYFEIRRLNDALAQAVDLERARGLALRERLRDGLRWNAVAHSREYPFILHSRDRLLQRFRGVAPHALLD